MMGTKVFMVILLLLILTSHGTCFGRKRSAKCRKDIEQTLFSQGEENSTSDYQCNCDPSEFGVVQKIPYLRSCSACDTIEIDFSSACVRCGMCLAISEKINETLLDVHELLTDFGLNDTEVELLLRTICDHSFQYYSLREVDGKRYISDRLSGSIMVSTSADGLWGKRLRDLCHYYLDEIGEVALYEYWQHWYNDDERYPDLSSVMCRNPDTMLRDCRSMEDTEKHVTPFKTYIAKVKITASYDKHDRRR